jgi:hypothetical protein
LNNPESRGGQAKQAKSESLRKTFFAQPTPMKSLAANAASLRRMIVMMPLALHQVS